ncbi:glycosyltransferase family 4 protein [Emticicia sp. SJ17W-69]|uniref:glycosyltransferase family 4 protein n=1 Tax=Emticicia sp. SJ17W-69 TaxID=3421657 RepID=UPI003EBA54CC
MRIGFDAKRAFNNYTGLGNYSRFIIESLLKYAPQHEYLAYTPKPPRDNKGLKLSPKLPTTLVGGGLWRSWLINNDLKKDNVDVFHGLSNEIPFGIKKSGVKSVVTIHDLIFLRYPELYPFIDRFIYNKKFRYACEKADAIVAVSQQTKEDIMEFYKIPPERIRVIYQDCQEIFHRKNPPNPPQQGGLLKKYSVNKPYILCVSSFSERKNQKRLIEAFQQLGLKDHELILVGGKSKYSQHILENTPSGVRGLFNVPSSDLPTLYQGAELFIYPSFFEGFGIPIVEALHSGVPVVAASGSCLEEAGGDGALYANPLDVNDLADKIKQVLTNSALRNNLILKGKEHVKQFSGERIAGQLVELYKEL